MKLSDWAYQTGVSYRTAWRWFHDGNLPVRAEQLGNGTILVYEESSTPSTAGRVVVYGRVSSHDQIKDLDRQVTRIKDYCAAKGLKVSEVVTEVGSGLNGKRPKLLKILGNKEITTIVVEHRDRLARFGIEMVDALLTTHNRELIVINEGECKNDIVQDFVDLATSMCARIYGKRSAKKRAEKAIEAADES